MVVTVISSPWSAAHSSGINLVFNTAYWNNFGPPSRVSKMNKTCKGPYKAPTLPERPKKWGADEILKAPLNSRKAVLEEFVHSWNQWANEVDNIFRQMSEQADELGATEEDLIKFIQMFSNHPPRPTLHGIEYYQKEERPLTKEFVENVLQARFHVRWNDFANKLERTYTCMANDLAQCRSWLSSKNASGADFGMSNLSLSDGPSTRTQLQSMLRSMLGPERAFQAVIPIEEHELSRKMDQMDIQERR